MGGKKAAVGHNDAKCLFHNGNPPLLFGQNGSDRFFPAAVQCFALAFLHNGGKLGRLLGSEQALSLIHIFIGYFKAPGPQWNQVPTLETNTQADDRGGLMPVIKSAMKVTSTPPVDIHAFRYEKGRHQIFLGTGSFLIVGVVPMDQPIAARNAQMEKENLQSLDWLYE